MASRLNPSHDQRTRDKIKTSQLINRLQKFVFDEPGENGEKVEIDSVKLRAIEVLLKKTLPDLSNVQVSGPGEGGEHTITFRTIYETK